MTAALAAAHTNLRNPPEIYTRIALEQLPGTIDFFADRRAIRVCGVQEPELQARFKRVNGQVIAALQRYQRWLQQQVLPRSHGEFRLGAAAFRAKLLYDEMVDTPLDRLLQIGTADLEHNQAEFERIAHELEPDNSTQQVIAELASDHPAPAALLESFRATFDDLIGFINEHHIISIPLERAPKLAGNPAIHARHHVCLDGHAGAVRKRGARSLLQRHAA